MDDDVASIAMLEVKRLQSRQRASTGQGIMAVGSGIMKPMTDMLQTQPIVNLQSFIINILDGLHFNVGSAVALHLI